MTLKLSDRLRSGVVRRDLSADDFSQVKQRVDELLADSSALALEVAVFERSEYRVEDVRDISGYAMGMTTQMCEALDNYCLDRAERVGSHIRR